MNAPTIWPSARARDRATRDFAAAVRRCAKLVDRLEKYISPLNTPLPTPATKLTSLLRHRLWSIDCAAKMAAPRPRRAKSAQRRAEADLTDALARAHQTAGDTLCAIDRSRYATADFVKTTARQEAALRAAASAAIDAREAHLRLTGAGGREQNEQADLLAA